MERVLNLLFAVLSAKLHDEQYITIPMGFIR